MFDYRYSFEMFKVAIDSFHLQIHRCFSYRILVNQIRSLQNIYTIHQNTYTKYRVTRDIHNYQVYLICERTPYFEKHLDIWILSDESSNFYIYYFPSRWEPWS